jgi:NAD(P)-dependent dehydrogenase (short-subunit alcohol dehydrogenase family)
MVTGGASGIGRASVLELAAHGSRLAVVDVDAAAAATVAREAEAAGATAARAIACDVADEAAVEAAFAACADLGRLGALVASAGVDRGGLVHELDASQWDAVLDVNLRGMFLTCKHAVRAFLADGTAGAIVCVSSPAATMAFPAAAAYCASKAGISALVRSLAVDYARDGIRVNGVLPGPTETPLMWANVPPDEVDAMRRTIDAEMPIGRLAQPEEIARLIAWLITPAASYMVGALVACDGGVMAKATISV